MKIELRKVSKPDKQGRVTVNKFEDGEEVLILPADYLKRLRGKNAKD